MIVRMKHLDLVCVAADKVATLERLRALGAVHLDLSAAAGSAVAAARMTCYTRKITPAFGKIKYFTTVHPFSLRAADR